MTKIYLRFETLPPPSPLPIRVANGRLSRGPQRREIHNTTQHDATHEGILQVHTNKSNNVNTKTTTTTTTITTHQLDMHAGAKKLLHKADLH